MVERRSGADRRVSTTVVLVDNEPLARAALAQALVGAGFEVVGQAADGEDAIELVLDLRPDVVVTAIALPGISDVEAIERIGLRPRNQSHSCRRIQAAAHAVRAGIS